MVGMRTGFCASIAAPSSRCGSTRFKRRWNGSRPYVSAKFNGGAVALVMEVDVESEWMRDSGPSAFGAAFARNYFEGRINGGTYEAEDKVFSRSV